MKSRCPRMGTILAYAFVALGLAAGPATVWALFPLPLRTGIIPPAYVAFENGASEAADMRLASCSNVIFPERSPSAHLE